MNASKGWNRISGGRVRRAARWLLPAATVVTLVLLLAPGLLSRPSATPDRVEARQAPRPDAAATVAEPWDMSVDESWAEPPEALLSSPSEELALVAPDRAEEPAEAVAKASEGKDSPAAPLDCIIEPYEVVEIGSPVIGLIETLHVERGDVVEAGQVLVQLESAVEKAAVEVARARARMEGQVQAGEARLELGQRRQERAHQLFDQQALSLDKREEIETEARLARHELRQAREQQRLSALELEQAQEALNRRTIRSPISGVVIDRLMSPGEVVDEETILKIARIDPLRVEVILPSAMFGSVEPGARAAVVPEFPGDQVHVASVSIVDRVIDAASGTFGVRLELPNAEHAVPGGLHCQVRFLTE